MKTHCRTTMLVIACVMAMVSISAIQAADNLYASLPNVNWKISHTQAPDYHMNIAFEKCAKYIAEKTGGKFVIDVYHSGTLGAEQEVIENMQMGTIAGNLAAASLLANFVPAYKMFALPAVFKDSEQYYQAMHDEEFIGKLNEACLEADLINYGYYQNFFRQLYSKRKIEKASDFTGQKIRLMGSPIFIDTFQALGCNPTTTAWGELYSALQLGVCEGMDHVAASVKTNAFYENLTYVCEPMFFTSPMFVIISKPMYDKLPKPYQELFDDVMNNMLVPDLQAHADDENTAALEFLTTEGKLTYVECDREEMHKIVAPVRDKYLKELEPWVQDMAKKIIAAQ